MAKNKILLTASQYAAHRGKNEGAVRYAIREGKLSASLIKDAAGGILIDRDLADQEWLPRFNPKEVTPVVPKKVTKKKTSKKKKSKKKREESTSEDEENPEYVPGKEWDPRNPYDVSMLKPIHVSRMQREAYETELARIKVEKEMGVLVSAKEAEEEWVKIATLMKTKVLGIPSKARQKMPEITDPQYAVLELICREILEEISESNQDSEED